MNKESAFYVFILLIIALFFVGNTSYAQQESQYTEYMYNTITINPAYAGSRKVLSFNGIYRSQWVGLDGAPETIAFSVNSPLGRGKVGVGFDVGNDRIGPSTETNVAADFSYTIGLNRGINLSFGLKGGFNTLNVDINKLNPDQQIDPSLYNVDKVSAIVGAGFFVHNDKWYVGLSSPNLLETKYYDDVAVSTATEKIHIYLIGGYVFNLSNSLKFKPTVLTKAVVGSPLAIDLSANFLFYERFTLGAAYRFDAAVSALVGFQISNQLMLGYAYDYDTTELGNYNSGSHEFFIRFEFGTKVRNNVNPRFF
ncbi:type IX secretion system membrane protein PorP/SprF [Joostella atrarenae]|uniref:Type IX secretion system membrane protein PorP/SprF n=1 Tax=Joostella atrarenae TaxID=679257 RepID=A0ABS9J7G8_9FLAO|nr:type IX secretion system membrane protein PorP/SprF [Joostella atrarenae]MCF8716333.1 type IX secretion system membrane protein PorP/SprF [Joostella atrarenae]